MRQAANLLPTGSAALWMAVVACGGDGGTPPVGPERPETTPVVSSIEMRPSERTIGILGTQVGVRALALTEDGEMLYGSYLDPGRFSWSSSAPDIATVDTARDPRTGRETHLITALREGTATITATSQGVTGAMTVTVRDAARLAWSVPVGTGAFDAGVAIGADGTIYVVNYQRGSTSRLFALSPQGSVIWTLETASRVISIPAIGADGTLYLGSRSGSESGFAGRLIAVDPGGTVRWVLENLDGIRSSPAIGPDGTIYVAADHHVYAVDPHGEIQWAYEAGDDKNVFVFSSPAVATDGTIYVGGEDHLLYAINPDGSLRWTFETGDRIRSSPAIGTDGTIYFGSHDGRLYAVNPDGTERWSVPLRCGLPWGCLRVASSPSISADGTIYVLAGSLFALDPGGSIRWSYPFGSTTPILGADGTVYGPLYALDAQGSLLWDYGTGGHIMGSPAIGADGMIIAASFSGLSLDSSESTVYAIVENGSTNGGFAGAPWPQERGSRANTGRAGG